MGFFKSMRDLHKEAVELEKTMPPPGERARQATSRMADLTNSMAAQTQALNQTVTGEGSGVEAMATVLAVRSVGMINFNPLMEIDLTVLRNGMAPYPATVRQAISPPEMSRLQAGASVAVRIGSADPSSVWIDLTRAP